MKRSTFAGAALALAFAPLARAQGPDPATVSIRSIAYAGSGCAAGTVAQNVAADAQAFTLLFSTFVAELDPGQPLSAARKNCQLAIDLKFPAGFSVAVANFDYRGFANLDQGTFGEQTAQYYFQGGATSAAMRSRLIGPRTEDYHFRDALGLAALVWSPCGEARALNIDTSVVVSGQGRGVMTVDSLDGEVRQTYGLAWKKCLPPPPPPPRTIVLSLLQSNGYKDILYSSTSAPISNPQATWAPDGNKLVLFNPNVLPACADNAAPIALVQCQPTPFAYSHYVATSCYQGAIPTNIGRVGYVCPVRAADQTCQPGTAPLYSGTNKGRMFDYPFVRGQDFSTNLLLQNYQNLATNGAIHFDPIVRLGCSPTNP